MAKANDKRFKNDQGVYFTKGLFFETSVDPEKSNVVYTLKQEDHPAGYPSLRRLYLEVADPTEYTFAQEYLGGWDHWKKFKDTEWFAVFLREWREELELKLKSKAFKEIMTEASNPAGKATLAANKFILETVRRIQQNKDIGERTDNKGRPSLKDIETKAILMAEEQLLLEQDAERILN